LRELLRRLDKLGLPAGDEPELVPDFGKLSRVENARFWELYDASHRDEGLANDELKEMQALLEMCPLVDPDDAGNPYAETHEERRERQRLERAFAGAFHNYAKQYSYIAVPNYADMLNEYRLEIGYQLFEKYGWIAGERDCFYPAPRSMGAGRPQGAHRSLSARESRMLKQRSLRMEV
jgi:hypothetical protein